MYFGLLKKIGLNYAALENEQPSLLPNQIKVAIDIGEHLKDIAIQIFSGYGSDKLQHGA